MHHHLKTFINCLCLLPFIGLLVGVFVLDSSFTDGTGAGKTIFFYALMGLVPLAASLSYYNNRRPLKYSVTDGLVPVFAALGLLVTYLNHPVWNTSMISLVLLVVLYFSLRMVLVQHRIYRNFLFLGLMVTGLVEAVWGLLQLYGYLPSQHALFRVTGSFFNPGPYAGYLAMILPMAVCYALQDGKAAHGLFRSSRWYYYLRWWVALATLLCILLILPATMSRAAWIAGGLGSIIVILCYLLKDKRWRIRTYIAANTKTTIAGVLAVALVLAIGFIGLYQLKKDSADGRALIWKVSGDVIEREWLGVGLGYFSGKYGRAQGAYFASGRGTAEEELLAGQPEYAFNEFIQVAVELGVLPLAILLTIVMYACWVGIRRGRLAEVGSLIALLIFSSMSYPFSLMPFLVALILLITACVSVSYRFTDVYDYGYQYLFNYRIRHRWNHIWIISLLVTSWVLVAWCLSNRYPVYLAHKQWAQARPLYRANAYEKVVEHYRDLLPHLRDQVHYLFEYGQALSKTGRYEESNKVIAQATRISADPMLLIVLGKNYMGLHDYKYAGAHFEWAAQRVPHRLYPYYMLAKAHYEAGDWDKAMEVAERVVTNQVKVHSPATREMRAEMKAMINQLTNDKGFDNE